MGIFKRKESPSPGPKLTRADQRFFSLALDLQKSTDPVATIGIIRDLVNLGDKRAIEPLHRALNVTRGGARREAARALRKLGWSPATPADEAALLAVEWDDDGGGIGYKVALRFAEEGNAPLLIEALSKEVGRGDGQSLRAAKLLGMIGEGSQIAMKALLDPLRSGIMGNEWGQTACVEALEKIGDEHVIAALKEIETAEWGKQYGRVQDVARRAIAEIKKRAFSRETAQAAINCAACGRTLGHDETMKAEATEVIERALGGLTTSDAARYMPNAMAGTAMKCNQCGQWICNGCALKFALEARIGMIRHSDCGGMFENPE